MLPRRYPNMNAMQCSPDSSLMLLRMAVLCIGTSCLAAVAIFLAITDDWVKKLNAEAALACNRMIISISRSV
jgi:hypothetical protein